MQLHRVVSRPASVLLGVGALVLCSSCVSKAQHEEALANIKYYQRNLQDLESYVGKLEAENQRLEGELGMAGGSPIEAGVTAEIDERLAELGRIMGSIGAAPGDVTVLEVEGGYGLRISDAVLFDSGSAELREDGRARLLQIVGEIKNRPFQRIWVRGHTDSDPVVRPETRARFPHGNLQLSAARAIEVAAVLTNEGGIARDQLVVAGFGPSDPVAPNTGAEKRKNRRVEIFVIEDAGGDE